MQVCKNCGKEFTTMLQAALYDCITYCSPSCSNEDAKNYPPVDLSSLTPTLEQVPLNVSMREAQVVAPVEDILSLFQQGTGVFICSKGQLPPGIKILRAEINHLTNELHVILGTVQQDLFWRNFSGGEPPAIPFFPKKSIQHVDEISDSALRDLMKDPEMGPRLGAFYNRMWDILNEDNGLTEDA